MKYSDVRYLLAKRSVDDRALNRQVLSALRAALGQLSVDRIRVLELGAGVGTMVTRLADWGVIGSAAYTLLDRDPLSLAAARDHLLEWAPAAQTPPREPLHLRRGDAALDVELVEADALEFLRSTEQYERYELVVANAVLDLMDLRQALPTIWSALRPLHLFWFSINFDGETIFLPEDPLDTLVMRLYHRSMDTRVRDGLPCGDSRTGRHLLELISATGANLLAAGSSDWVVFPRDNGYPEDEAYFLHHIVNTIWVALKDEPELMETDFEAWIAARHRQVDEAQLIYVAHQLDVLGRTGKER